MLYKIAKLKQDGNTGKEIAEILGWSQSLVSQYNNLNEKIFTTFLELARQYQIGRVNQEFTTVKYDFTEHWFRDSGLYDLNEEFQLLFFDKFKADEFTWKKEIVRRKQNSRFGR